MNTQNNFYIILPSNSSVDHFPQNTMSDYTTVLSNPLNLEGNYEVALTELNYSPYFSISLGSITIPNKIFNLRYGGLYYQYIIPDIEIQIKLTME